MLFIGSLGAQITGVGNFSHVVSNMDRSIEFYRDVIGLELPGTPGAFTGNPAILKLANAPGAQFKRTVARIPGTTVSMMFLEFKDIDRKPIHTRTQDPGTPMLQLRARDVDAVAKPWKAAGGEIVSANGESVSLAPIRLSCCGSQRIDAGDPSSSTTALSPVLKKT